jgi:hypothetical protein
MQKQKYRGEILKDKGDFSKEYFFPQAFLAYR